MFETLDDVPWADLAHAYGPAADVPGQLRGLASPDAKVRDAALDRLYGNVFHQGTRFAASPHVVPFLAELCGDDRTPRRDQVLRLWAAIIAGYFDLWDPGHWCDGVTVHSYHETYPLGAEGTWAEGDGWLADIYARSMNAAPLLGRLLLADEDAVRAAAANVLACLRTRPESLPPLREALSAEDHPQVRAALLFALGELGDVETVRRAAADDAEPPAARCMAACELSKLDPRPWLAPLLVGFIEEPVEGYENVPGAAADSAGDAGTALSRLPLELRAEAVPPLIRRLRETQGFALMPVAASLLSAAFERSETLPDPLSPAQREVLTELVANPEVWSLGNLSSTFAAYGLPSKAFTAREETAALLGVRVADDRPLLDLASACHFAEMGFAKEARERIEAAVAADPAVFARAADPAACHLAAARAYAETDPDRAAAAFEAAAEIDPRAADRVRVREPLWGLLEERGLV